MTDAVTIENGFAATGAGEWLSGRPQPVAFSGSARRRGLRGWAVRDRSSLSLVETSGKSYFADASRPFLTFIPCAAPLKAVSSKVLVAPAASRVGAEAVKPIPFSASNAFAVTEFAHKDEKSCWVVMATVSRTLRVPLADGETLSVKPDSVVAWTGEKPTGFCARLGLLDFILPRMPSTLVLNFHGPCVVWIEGGDSSRRDVRGRFAGRRQV